MKAKRKLFEEQYQQKQRDYQDLKEETLKVVRGTSRLNVDLLNNLIEETTVQMAEWKVKYGQRKPNCARSFPALNRCGRSTPS